MGDLRSGRRSAHGMWTISQSASAGVVVHRVLYFENAHSLVDIRSEGPLSRQRGQSLIDNGLHALAVRQIFTELHALSSVDFDKRLAPSLPYCWKTMARVPIKRKKWSPLRTPDG